MIATSLDTLKQSDYVRLYSTDASVYEQVPAGVRFPRCVDDCIELVREASASGIPLIPRGGGTSIAGQCVGKGVVVDFSRYMAAILTTPEENCIWVQPGVVLDDLNDALRPHGLYFPVDISTSSRCTIGGMVGNNAAGSHSIIYGTTRENVLEVEGVLDDGSLARFGPLDAGALADKLGLEGREGDIYRVVYGLVAQHRDAILAAFPPVGVVRRNTGYALDALASGQPWVPAGAAFNLSNLFCGSEGTLGLVTAVRLRLAPLVAARSLVCAHFESVRDALVANAELVKWPGLAASELMDAHVLRAAAAHPGQRANGEWVVGRPGAVLALEFFAETSGGAHAFAGEAVDRMRRAGQGYAWPILDAGGAKQVWALRKAGLGLLMGLQQRARPVAVIEDSAVPVESLAQFAQEIAQMMQGLGLDCVFYGHASVGLLHIRPNLDLDQEADRARFREVATKTAALVKQHHGSLSGEHGDGRLRAPYLRGYFGEAIFDLLKAVKAVFDPRGIFNPGKILPQAAVDDDIRQRPMMAMAGSLKVDGGFDWRTDGGFDLVLERCNGSATCRQHSSRGAMCPTYQVTGEELYSTRGRANLLRQAFASGSRAELDDPLLDEAMKSCLGCKACRSECPSGVDMAAMKSEFLFRRYQVRKQGGKWRPLDSFVANQGVLLNLVSRIPSGLRAIFGRVLSSMWLARLLDMKQPLPRLAARPFSRNMGWLPASGAVESGGGQGQVVVLVDPFTQHFEPAVAHAALSVLHRLGLVTQAYVMPCSLRVPVSLGYLDEARQALLNFREELDRWADVPVIVLEPSELHIIRDETIRLLGPDGLGEFGDRFLSLEEYLLHEQTAGRLTLPSIDHLPGKVWVHPHCHERSVGLANKIGDLLGRDLGVEAGLVSSGCCGMGGAFAYLYPDMSKMVFEQNVRQDALRDPEGVFVVSGMGCRQQFRSKMPGIRVQHLAQFLLGLWHP